MSLLNAVIREADKTNTNDVTISPNELMPKIIDLSDRLMVFSWGLQNYYIDIYLTSDSSRSLEQMNYKNRKYRANTDLEELQEHIDAFRKTFGNNNGEINNACKKLDVAVKTFNDACTLVDGTYILQSSVRDLKSFKYVDAIVQLKELHKRIDKVECQGSLATAVDSFRDLSESQLAASQGQLSLEFSNMFRWGFNIGVNTLIYSITVLQNDPILLETVLKALYITDQMIIDIQPFSYFFVKVLVRTIIRYNCLIYTEDKVGALVFNIEININDPERPSIPTIFNNLTAIFEFLHTTLGAKLDPDDTFFDCLGDCNRDEFFNTLIQDCIKLHLPSCEKSLQVYKEIALELGTFNKFLVDINYVEPYKSPLKKYIEHTELLMYDTKYKKMVAEVRVLTKEFPSQILLTVGSIHDVSDPSILDVTNTQFRYDLKTPLFFPKCVISENVNKITSWIAKCLEESAELPLEYGLQLVPYVTNIAEMYHGLITKNHEVRLKTHAFEIAVFFNDTQYLAHSLVGPPWKNVLPRPIADQLNMAIIDQVYNLRISGIEKLSMFLQQKRSEFLKIIEGSCHNWSLKAFDIFNGNVDQVLGMFWELKTIWCELLPGRMYMRAMSLLVDSIAEAMVKRSLRYVDDISEEVVSLIASRFQYTINEIQELCPEVLTEYRSGKFIEKFLLIPKLFTAQLLEIGAMWEEQHVKYNYSSDEIRLIIKMRFPSNESRLKILKKIQ